MQISATIFLVALIGIFLMVAVKLYELKKGEEFVFIKWRKKTDVFIHSWILRAKNFINDSEHQIVSAVKGFPLKVLHFISWLNEIMHKRYGKHIDLIKGRNTPSNSGSASFFVSTIAEYKKDLEEKE